MGRALLLLCTGALVMSTIVSGSLRRGMIAQETRISAYESDVISREYALSALNLAMPFISTRFDSLVSGQTVSTRPLIGLVSSGSSQQAQQSQGLLGGLIGSIGNVLTTSSNSLRLTAGGSAQPLMPMRSVNGDGGMQVSVRAVDASRLEVIAEGVQLHTNDAGTSETHRYKVRRVYSKATALDAALVVLAPAITTTLSGSYLFDGRDYDTSGTLTGITSNYRNGIKTNSDVVAQRIGAVVGATNKSRVMGVNSAGVEEEGNIVRGEMQAKLDAIFDEAFLYTGSARQTLTSSSVGTATYGSATNPKIVVRNGSLNVTGTLTGTGMLVVNGNLTTSGSGRIIWDGVIMVRKDSDSGTGSTNTAADNLTTTLGSNSRITGSLVLMQRSSSFVMPFAARLKVYYAGSNAGLKSSINVEHSHNGQLARSEIISKDLTGRNSTTASFSQQMVAGQQLNFFISVYYPSNYSTSSLRNTRAYNHYARGHFSASSAKPYGVTRPHPDLPYQWYMAFEDIDESINSGYGTRPDWDYNTAGEEDQMIRLVLECRARNTDGSLKVVGGQQQYEECTPNNPDTQMSNTTLNWTGLTSTSGTVTSPSYGAMLTFNNSGAQIKYSSASIKRLAPFLTSLRSQAQLVLLDSWSGV